MENISRRDMLEISGISAVGSLIGVPALSKTSGDKKLTGQKLKIIVAGAHPDDPESGCGGTMALFAAQGHEVVSAYLTRGEAGITGKSNEEAARIRTDESLRDPSCKIGISWTDRWKCRNYHKTLPGDA
jgi:hypothetical protein